MSDLSVFYVLDLSKSMKGEKLDILNHTVEECNETLLELANEKNAELKVAMMTFSDSCDWMTPHGPEPIEDFAFDFFKSLNGTSNLGIAIYELNSKLNNSRFYKITTNDYLPIIIFITDGHITDNYKVAVNCCRANKIYEKSIKIALDVGKDSDFDNLSSIVTSNEYIFPFNKDDFKKSIKFLNVDKSILLSNSTSKKNNIKTIKTIKSKKNNNTNYINNDLRSIISYLKKFDLDIFFDYRLTGYLSDFAPELVEERNMIKTLNRNGIIQEIIFNMSSDENKQFWLLHKTLYFLDKDKIEIVNILTSVLGYKMQLDIPLISSFNLKFEKNQIFKDDDINTFIKDLLKKYYDNKKYVEYYRLGKQIALNGDSEIQYLMGLGFLNGDGISRNYEEAGKYFELCAKQGNSEAQYHLGELYFNNCIGNDSSENAKLAFKYFKNSAKQGNDKAELYVAKMYRDGIGVEKNVKKAFLLFKQIADQGNAVAQLNTGLAFFSGKGVEKNYKEAFKYLKQSANQGNSEAQMKLGEMYWLGGEKNCEEAIKYFKQSADQNNAEAQLKLGCIYYLGYIGKQHFEKAFDYFKKSADNGNSNSQYFIGHMYCNGEVFNKDNDESVSKGINYKEAKKYFEQSADQGNADAQFELGLLFRKGLGTAQNNKKASEYFKKSADQGNAKAQYQLGDLYYNNLIENDSLKNEEMAFRYFIQSSNQNNADAQFKLGCMFYYGCPYVKRDYKEAYRYFMLSAEQNNADAQFKLGCIFYFGYVGEQDLKKALYFFKLSADNGNSDAQMKLGEMYSEGLGVAKNFKEAKKYFKLCAHKGNIAAKEFLSNLNKPKDFFEKIRNIIFK